MAAATLPLNMHIEQLANETAHDEAAPDSSASRYPAALKDRAFDLYSRGFRSPAIATELGVSERTIRHWLQTTIQQLAQDDVTTSPEITRQQRALAIESQRAVSAIAWTAYQQLSDAYTHLMSRALAPTNSQPERLLASINRLAATAARHLTVIISANREIARLQGQAVAQTTRDQRAASQQSAADDAAELLRILTTPIPTPSARPSALDTLPPLHNNPTTHISTTTNQPPLHDIPSTPQISPTTNQPPAHGIPSTPGLLSTEGLPASDIPPLPAHIIAAVMDHHRKMYPDDTDDTDSAAAPTNRLVAPPSSPSPHGPFPPREGGWGLGQVSLPHTNEEPGAAAQISAVAQTPPKTKIAAKTATPPRPQNKPNHQPTIAIPSRTARKLKKPRPS